MMCAYNSCFPGSSWIAIVPESGTTPEIFRSIEPRALITAPLRARKITRIFAATGGGERGRGTKCGGGNFAVFRQGSFRLFWLQPPGCRYCHNFRRAPGRLPRCKPISTPHYPFAVISPLATALRNESEIGNFEASASVNSANSDGRPGQNPVSFPIYFAISKPRDKIEIPRILAKLSGKFNQIRGTTTDILRIVFSVFILMIAIIAL